MQSRFGDRLAALNAGIAKEGGFYLFTLRLVPALPFFVINLAMGVTMLRTWTFYWVSQLGMLAGTLVYVNAGTQLARIDSLSGIVSPGVLGSLVLLGVFPLIAKKVIDMFQARKVYARFKKPVRFDRNLVVIGGGSAGLVTAYIASAIKAKVTLVEKHALGGDCLNTGCVPSKALIRSAKFLSHVERAKEFGMRSASADFDFGEVMERVQRVIKEVEPHDSVERYTGTGCGRGAGHGPHRVALGGGDHLPRWAGTGADNPRHRHRGGCAALRAPHSGPRRPRPARVADLRDNVCNCASGRSAWWCSAAAPSAAN